MTTPSSKDSATETLNARTWSNEETAAYEAAVEAVNGAVGAYSSKIAKERGKERPDQAVIEAAIAARRNLAQVRESLRSEDPEQIAEARQQYAQLARDIREGRA
ncbi:hypothetical protein ACWEJZ_31645 [Streptomyces bacillaris]